MTRPIHSSFRAVLAALLLAGCGKAPEPPPAPVRPPPAPPRAAPVAPVAPVAPPPAPTPSPEQRIARITDALREELAAERAKRKAAVDENLALYRDIRANYRLPDTLAAAWDWVVKGCAVTDPGPAPGDIVWDDRLGVAVVAGREPHAFTLPLGDIDLDLRWIDPTSFWMGSLDTEAGRNPDEKVHEVALAGGFWLGTFEVTQEQWFFVMGDQPSYFKAAGPRAPVERVSWRDAQLFLAKLNTLVQQGHLPWAGVLFRLPTEAEWELACRAGTFGATYAGEMHPAGANNCPALGQIAWYGGNAGVDYDGGWDSTKWMELEIPHTRAGTHPVGLKQPNAWGFHDLLGNVWEWCDDLYAAYPEGIAAEGPAGRRVARGASWGNQARAVRAATRNALDPDTRHERVGFRVAASWK